jgi:integrase
MQNKLTLFKRANGVYYVRQRSDTGADTWTSTGQKTKREALAVIQAGIKAKVDCTADQVQSDLDLLSSRVLEYVTANYAPKTLEAYRLSSSAFIRIIGNKPLKDVTRSDVDRFKVTRMSELSPVSVNIQLRTLRSAFNLAVRWDMMPANPFVGVGMIRIPDSPPSYLTFMQWDLLDACIRGKWLEDIIVFAICTGMRQGEILHLEWRHVDLERRIVHVTSTATFKTKAGKRRVVPLNEKAIATLTGRPQGGERVFMYEGLPIRRDSLTKAFKRLVREAGLPEAIHFHSLRHTFASWLVQDGVSLFQVGRLLGHTNTRTTEIYAHLQPETMHDVVDRIKL